MKKTNTGDYIVLARKYRPKTFVDLIGQEAVVRTLTHAIEVGRIAHAFILTGIRGTGKTSTARIIARALNCIGPDGKSQAPVVIPCNACEHCKAIAEDRHVDVIEMDAASRTGVESIREIIESVYYLPAMARYKVYIIDEVHMLSKSAFNALLKTLEEPPKHVKFIFATTEIRKIPVTILSRCMRFDLARVELSVLAEHLSAIVQKEGVKAEPQALMLIAMAAEGSVRDALSLLDQAIAHGTETVTVESVRTMLGLIGREQVFALYENILGGKLVEGLKQIRELYRSGADPLMLLQDLLEITHFLTQVKITPELAEAVHVSEHERKKGKALAERLSLPYLARAWQMLVKGLGEARIAPSPLMAAEMILVRLACIAELPPPGDLVKQIKERELTQASKTHAAKKHSLHEPIEASLKTFEDLTKLFAANGEHLLHNWLQDVHVAIFDASSRRLEFALSEGVPTDLPNKLILKLQEWTGLRWGVTVTNDKAKETLKQKQARAYDTLKEEVLRDPDVQKIMEAFPDAKITKITLPEEREKASESESLSGVR